MDIHQLVIRNLSVLEEAPSVAEEIDKNVLAAIFEKTKNWAENDQKWQVYGDYDYDDLNKFHFSPHGWPREDEEPKAWYLLGAEKEEDYYYFISSLTGVVPHEFGVWFQVDSAWITRVAGKGARPQTIWQHFLADQLIIHKNLQSAGFRMIKNDLFLPIRLNSNDLADSYPNTLSDALFPVDEALRVLGEFHSEIDAILQAADRQFTS